MRRAIPIACLLIACALSAPAVARTAIHSHFVATTDTPLRADGERYAAYARAGEVTLLDTRAGEPSSHWRLSPGCTVDAAARALFLINCRAGWAGQTPYVLEARRRVLWRVPGAGTTFSPAGDLFSAIGRVWLGGSHGSPHITGPRPWAYLNWRTGKMRIGNGFTDSGPPRDLDSPTLARTRVTGLRDGRYRVVVPGAPKRPLKLIGPRGRKTVLDRCAADDCGAVSIGGGWVTWQSTHFAYAYSLAGGRRLKWIFSGFGPDSVGHTTTRIFFNIAVDHGASYHVYDARLPGAPSESGRAAR